MSWSLANVVTSGKGGVRRRALFTRARKRGSVRNGTDPSSSPVYLILSRFAPRFKKKSASEYDARRQEEVLSPILERECDYSRVGSLKEIRSEGRRGGPPPQLGLPWDSSQSLLRSNNYTSVLKVLLDDWEAGGSLPRHVARNESSIIP